MPTPRKYASPAERQAAYRRRLAATNRMQAAPPPPVPGRSPSAARWPLLIRHAQQLLRTAEKAMQEYYDQRSESWQESERGETLLERLQNVQEAQAALEEGDDPGQAPAGARNQKP